MKAYTNIRKKLAIYGGIALAVLGAGGALAWPAVRCGGMLGAVGGCLIGAAALILAAIILAPVLAEICANLAVSGLNRLIMPEDHYDRPQPAYSVPEGRVKSGDFEGAMALYEQIAADYPKEIRPWMAMMETTVARMHDRKRADELLRRALVCFPDKKTQRLLEENHHAMVSLLQPHPDWYQPGPRHLPERRRTEPPAPHS